MHKTVRLSQQVDKSVTDEIRLGVPVMFHTEIKLAPICYDEQLNKTTCTILIIFSCILLVGLKSNCMSTTLEALVRVSSSRSTCVHSVLLMWGFHHQIKHCSLELHTSCVWEELNSRHIQKIHLLLIVFPLLFEMTLDLILILNIHCISLIIPYIFVS